MDVWTAVARGDPRGIERCLAEGGTPDVLNRDGETPLLVAAGQGSEDAVRTLLGLGASPEAADRQGRTALMRAAERGHARVARLLLGAGAEVRRADRRGQRALGIALDDPLGRGEACSRVACVIAERYPPAALRDELRRRFLGGEDELRREHVRTVGGVNESVVRLRGMGVPRGLDVSERERLTMFLEDVVKYDREVRDLLASRGAILKRIEEGDARADLMEEIRRYPRRARALATAATQLRMERVVLERLIGR